MTCANAAPPLGFPFGNFTLSNGKRANGFAFGVGSPLQYEALWASTTGNYVVLANAEDCFDERDDECITRRGGVFNSSKSRSYKETTEGNWNGTLPDAANEQTFNIFFNDNVQFGFNGSASGYPLLMKQTGRGSFNGLGIGPRSTFLDEAVRSGSAPYKAFGFWPGSRSLDNPWNGTLWIGGYNTGRLNGPLVDFPANPGCETCTIITDLMYEYSGGSTSLFSNSSEQLKIRLHPWVDTLAFPEHIYRNFVNVTNSIGTYLGEDAGTLTFLRGAQMGNLSVTLNNNYKTVIPASELFAPPRGYDDNGDYVIKNNSFLATAIKSVPETQEPLWGIPFMTQNYFIVDYEKRKFQLGPTRQGKVPMVLQPLCEGIAASSPTSTTTPQPTSNAPTPSAAPHTTNAGAIAGGVVGGILGLAIVSIMGWFILRGKKRERALQAERDVAVTNASDVGRSSRTTSPHNQYVIPEISEVHAQNRAHSYHMPMNDWLSGTNLQSQNPQTLHELGDQPSQTRQFDHLRTIKNTMVEMPTQYQR